MARYKNTYEGNIIYMGGVPHVQYRDRFIEWLKRFPEDQAFSFECSPIGSVNESKQRSLYFVYVDILATELGWSHTEVHEFLKENYNGYRTTKGMTTKQWSDFLLKVQAFSADKGIVLPKTEEE